MFTNYHSINTAMIVSFSTNANMYVSCVSLSGRYTFGCMLALRRCPRSRFFVTARWYAKGEDGILKDFVH